MPGDIKIKIQRAAEAGPDMRKPQYPGGYEPPAEGVAWARFIGYIELGQHECMRDGALVYRDRARMVFELGGQSHPGRLVDGVRTPHVISVETDIDLSPSARFLDTFSRMNFENRATHMTELLGDQFVVYVKHVPLKSASGVYATLEASKGYLIYPAKGRHEDSGPVVCIPVVPRTYRLVLFAWASADMQDWYDLYISGEWPAVLDENTGDVVRPARSKNILQERIMSARNWPEHSLAAVAMLGPDPHEPTAEELERQRAEDMEENCRHINEAIDKAIAAARTTYRKGKT
ncbi:hypothetical protein BWP39_03170 [Paraburkholderia acidicola]|uniref:Uncharacterized protein n=1 Tax=Paraburkholderia acidicola TaxID=1912599 RepID=A0A2A4F4F4_9BURK|nr:hypothetical protein [Paraburkholderia acidicola]PCE27518.1 hypothetical protein BWP39_03170 [Paraburkholderia acidicola]